MLRYYQRNSGVVSKGREEKKDEPATTRPASLKKFEEVTIANKTSVHNDPISKRWSYEDS
jgi:hypothetical protein